MGSIAGGFKIILVAAPDNSGKAGVAEVNFRGFLVKTQMVQNVPFGAAVGDDGDSVTGVVIFEVADKMLDPGA